MQVRPAEIEARLANDLSRVVLAAVDLDEPALAKGRGFALEEDEAQRVGVGMELFRVVEPEIDAPQPCAVDPGDRGAFELGMVDCRQLSLGCGGGERNFVR